MTRLIACAQVIGWDRQVVALSLEIGGLRRLKRPVHWRIRPINEMRQHVSGGML